MPKIISRGFVEYFKSALEIIKLNRKSISEVSSDENATKWAVVMVLVSAFISALLSFVFYSYLYKGNALFTLGVFSWYSLISTPLFSLISLSIWVAILHLISKLFKGSGSYTRLFRVLGFASLLTVFSWIPILGFIILLWSLVITVVAVSEIENLTTGKSILVIAIPAIVLLVTFAVLMIILIGATPGLTT